LGPFDAPSLSGAPGKVVWGLQGCTALLVELYRVCASNGGNVVARLLQVFSAQLRYKRSVSSTTKEIAMNWDSIEGKWKQLKGQVKEKWGKLTDDDFTWIGGKKDQLVGKVQERYGYEKAKAEEEVDTFARNCRCE
jgi:uncharacterized protein YjbJ (UPF0337 family)